MKTESKCLKSSALGLNEGCFSTDLHLTNLAANENLMYARELDALPAKQQAVSERMKKLEEASGDPRRMGKESADEVWKGWGMLIY